MNNLKWSFAIVLTLLTANTWAGGGWPQPKGKGYFKLGQTLLLQTGIIILMVIS